MKTRDKVEAKQNGDTTGLTRNRRSRLRTRANKGNVSCFVFVHISEKKRNFFGCLHPCTFLSLINIFEVTKAHYLRLKPCWHIFLFFWKYFIYSCTIYLQVPKPIPVALDDLCRQTKFTRQEIRVMYRGFKTVRFCIFFFSLLLSHTLS